MYTIRTSDVLRGLAVSHDFGGLLKTVFRVVYNKCDLEIYGCGLPINSEWVRGGDPAPNETLPWEFVWFGRLSFLFFCDVINGWEPCENETENDWKTFVFLYKMRVVSILYYHCGSRKVHNLTPELTVSYGPTIGRLMTVERFLQRPCWARRCNDASGWWTISCWCCRTGPARIARSLETCTRKRRTAAGGRTVTSCCIRWGETRIGCDNFFVLSLLTNPYLVLKPS